MSRYKQDKVMVVDDEEDIGLMICRILREEGYRASAALTAQGLFEGLKVSLPQLILLDVWLQEPGEGMRVLEMLQRYFAHIPVLMMSGHGTLEMAVEAIKKGAIDFIEKPFRKDCLLLKVSQVLEHHRLKLENRTLKNRFDVDELQGISSPFRSMQQSLKSLSENDGRLLITGEPGTGKERCAWEIHRLSQRSYSPFYLLPCQEIAVSWEALFFGSPEQEGLAQSLQGGTLVLEEITALSLEKQTHFMRFLQDVFLDPTLEKKRLDIRLITTSRFDPAESIRNGKLKEGLYHRLNVLSLKLPPLRDRKEDIPVLLNYFIQKQSTIMNSPVRFYSQEALMCLYTYQWPGNIRELKNVVEGSLMMASQDKPEVPMGMSVLPSAVRSHVFDQSFPPSASESILSLSIREAREAFEKQYLAAQIVRFKGNISETAKFIGMDRSALHRKLKNFALESSFEESAENHES